MVNLVDIQNVVGTLVTYFAMGGGDAAVEFIKGVTVNGALKLTELKDELMGKPEVEQAIAKYKEDPYQQKQQLEEVLTKVLTQHPTFQQQTAVQVRGDIKAEKGSVAAAVINGEVKITNKTK